MADYTELGEIYKDLRGRYPLARRGTLYPFGTDTMGQNVFAVPQVIKDMADTIKMFGRATKGEYISPEEAAFAALNLAGMGGAAGLKAAPRGSLAMGASKKALPMDKASRMARAREMGFDVDNPVYKAMYPYDYTKEMGKYKGPLIKEINRPSEFPSFHGDEPGVNIAGFFGDKATANKFAAGAGDNQAIYPSLLRKGKIKTFDAKGDYAGNIQFGKSGKPFRDAVRSGKYDTIVIKNTKDEGDIFVAINPQNIRSVNAAFDPAKANSADLLAINPAPLSAFGLMQKREPYKGNPKGKWGEDFI